MIRRKVACWAASMGLLSSLAVLAPTSTPVQAAQPRPGHTRLVPDAPRTNVPRITTGEITDIEYIGNRVFVAGSFTSIRNNASGNTTSYNQPYLASFDIDTGLIDTTFRPIFGGGGVTEIEASPDGTKLFVVGRFNTVNGVTKRKVASINPANGRSSPASPRTPTPRRPPSRRPTPPSTSAGSSPPSTARSGSASPP